MIHFDNHMREQRTRFADDPHRPQYHFLPPANWMNDPNGLIQWQKRYHLFYQYNPQGPYWGRPEWGHAVSEDLVHWRDLPPALIPSPDGPDQDGCYSGCTVVNNAGVPTIIYTGVQPECTCLAHPDERTDDLLVNWKKYPGNPVIAGPPPGLKVVGFRDHSAWRDDGAWYQVIGSGLAGVGGAALLYRSPDLVNWEYLHPLATGDVLSTSGFFTGTMWECPDFFELGDRHLLVISPWDDLDRRQHRPLWFAGSYHSRRFAPHAAGAVDAGGSIFYAPQTFLDAEGRRIMFGWIKEDRSPDAQIAAGWAGLASLPRVLSLSAEGILNMEPAPELAALRGRYHYAEGSEDARRLIESVEGDALEISAEFAPVERGRQGPSGPFGLRLRCSPDDDEGTAILYEPGSGLLTVDRSRSSLSPETGRASQAGRLALHPGEGLRLRIFLDRSVVEVFANERFCLTGRIYPSRPDSLGLDLILAGPVELERLEVWEMRSIWGAPESP